MASLSPAKAQVSVPAVNCTGELSPRSQTLPLSGKVDIDIPAPEANQLAMYLFDAGMLLGPRGWECHTQGGVQASAVTLMPNGSANKSQGEVYVVIIGDTQMTDAEGRYVGVEGSMSPWANTYFPEEMAKETAAGYGPKTTIKLHRYQTDRVWYPPPRSVTITDNLFGNVQQFSYTDFLATYMTPDRRFGVGSEILFGFGHDFLGYGFMGYQYHGLMPSNYTNGLPIQGYIKLHINPNDVAETVNLFAISLPKEQLNLLSPILGYAEKLYRPF